MLFLDDGKTHILLALALASLLAFAYLRLRRTESHPIAFPSTENEKSGVEKDDPLAAYYAINPLPDFDWRATPPIKLRPFKPKYHLTMGECRTRSRTRIPSPALTEMRTNNSRSGNDSHV
jgi:hypothetical protein